MYTSIAWTIALADPDVHRDQWHPALADKPPVAPGGMCLTLGSRSPSLAGRGLGEGRPCGAPVLVTNLRPPLWSPLAGGRVEVAKHMQAASGTRPVATDW